MIALVLADALPASLDQAEAERIFVCRRCDTEIASRRALFAIRSSSHEQVFPNPYGQLKVIFTFREARSVSAAGAPTAEFTWFAGYTWRVAYCADCRHHLGWLFEGGDTPPAFYGLLKDELKESEIKAS